MDEDGQVVTADDYYFFGMQMPGRSYNVAFSGNQYKYNSKELDDENGLNTYHYGAREYDPEIARFNRVDRFADKYPSMSPYSYGANNPMLFIDVNGDSVKIHYQTGFWSFLGFGTDRYVTYDNGNLTNEDGSEYTGNNSFVQKTVDALNTISEGENGGKLVGDLVDSEKNFYIKNASFNPREPGANEQRGQVTYWNPSKTSSAPQRGGGLSRPSFVGLTHELGHAHDRLDI